MSRRLLSAIFLAGLSLILTSCLHPPEASDAPARPAYPVGACVYRLPTVEPEVQLPVPHLRQTLKLKPNENQSETWAVSVAMVVTYLGKPMAPCEVTSIGTESGFPCCRHVLVPGTIAYEQCRLPADVEHIDHTLELLGLHAVYTPRPLSSNELRAEISNGRPVIIAHADDKVPGLRHFMVVTGYRGKLYHALDPTSNGLALELNYEDLLYRAGKLPWRETWSMLSFRADACNPRFDAHCACLHAP